MSVYAPAIDYVWELMRAYGVDPEPVMAQAGIDPQLRFDPSARIPRGAMNALHQAAWDATGDAAFGLRVAQAYHPSHMGALGYAWLASPTLRSAWEKMHRYSKIDSDSFRLTRAEHGDEFHVGFFWDGHWAPIPPQIYTVMALLVHLCRMIGSQDVRLRRAEFAAPAPADPAPFEEHFRCELRFDAPQNLLVLPTAELDRALPRAHPELERATDEMVVKYLAQRDRADIVSQVRAALFESLDEGNVSAERIAEQLHLSVRTLRRRLKDADWSFRDLLTDVRRQLALHYIQDESLTLTEISYLLGFSEQSSFTRAFRGWTGTSPTAARRGNEAAAD